LLLRKHEKPLAQVINRLAEKDYITDMQEIGEITNKHDKTSQGIIMKQPFLMDLKLKTYLNHNTTI